MPGSPRLALLTHPPDSGDMCLAAPFPIAKAENSTQSPGPCLLRLQNTGVGGVGEHKRRNLRNLQGSQEPPEVWGAEVQGRLEAHAL